MLHYKLDIYVTSLSDSSINRILSGRLKKTPLLYFINKKSLKIKFMYYIIIDTSDTSHSLVILNKEIRLTSS